METALKFRSPSMNSNSTHSKWIW